MNSNLSATFNVRITGRGSQPIVFAHGLGCDQNMWRFVAPLFEEKFKVVLFDYIGSGKSDVLQYSKEKYNSLHGYAEDVIAICNSLRLQDVIFVGHSVSCMIGLLASISQPHLFSRIIMVAPSPFYMNDSGYKGGFEKNEIEQLLAIMEKNLVDWANLYTPKIMGNEGSPELSNELKESFCTTDPAITHQFSTVTFYSDNRKDLSKLTLPCLILQCREDILAPLEVGEYMHTHTPGSTLRILNATGHCPHLSAPEETVRVIKEYLSVD